MIIIIPFFLPPKQQQQKRKKKTNPTPLPPPPNSTPTTSFFQTLVGETFPLSQTIQSKLFSPNYSVQPVNHLYNQITCQLARFFQKCLELGPRYQLLDDTSGVMDNQ